MAIFDRTGLFSDRQAVTATATSTNTVDLGLAGTPYGSTSPVRRDVGKGTQVPLHCSVSESFNNLTSLVISIETDDNASFTSAKTVYTSPTYAAADLVTGARYLLPDYLPTGTDERYVRLRYTVAGTAPTTGRITAGVVFDRQTN